MSQLMFDYARLPYGAGGQHADHNRFNWRCETLLTRNRHLLEGKVVLDLACNTGRLSYPCLALGAKKVVGVEARAELIAAGKEHLTATEYAGRMEWVQADIFKFLEAATPRQFDVVLCFGFLYHTVRQVDFFRQMRRLEPEHVIIDTSVARNYLWYGFKNFLRKPPCLHMIVENPELTSDTTDEDGVAFWPTCSLLESLFNVANYDCRQLPYSGKDISDWSGLKDYRKGQRVSYLAHRRHAHGTNGKA